MRISSTLFFQTGLNSINAQQSDLMHLYQQIGSGQRMVTPADDPLAAAQAINISQSLSLNERFAANREVAKRNLGVEENTLNSVTGLMQDIKTALVQAGNGTLSDADRATLADVLNNAKSTMLGLANSRDGSGQYLFSGSEGRTQAFLADSKGAITYQGDDGQRKIQADQTRQIAGSDVGSDVFNRAAPGTNSYLTAAGGENAGNGVIGAPTLSGGKGAHVSASFTIVFTGTGPGTGDYNVKDHNDVVVATGTYNPAIGSITLPNHVQVKLSGVPAKDDTLTVTPAAAAGAKLNIFDTLDQIIGALSSSLHNDSTTAQFQNTLASAMQRIDVHYDNVLTVRASVGARMNEIEALDSNGALRTLSYKTQLSGLEDVDYYSATMQLELRKSALEAAALAFRKIQGTSLFNMGAS
jgi:flagellar hook-associated protein 3 FlgL